MRPPPVGAAAGPGEGETPAVGATGATGGGVKGTDATGGVELVVRVGAVVKIDRCTGDVSGVVGAITGSNAVVVGVAVRDDVDQLDVGAV